MTNEITNKKTNKKLTQAEERVLGWAGVLPDAKEATVKPKDRKSINQMMTILTTDPIYVANPELAFGIIRRLMTGNVIKQHHFTQFVNKHPVFIDLNNRAIAGQKVTFEVDGTLLQEAKDSKWGQEHEPYRTIEVSGEVEITWVDKDGVKTELTTIGYEYILYKTDSRPYIALNCGGGSAIRHFLFKAGGKPNYKINNDANSKRFVVKGKTVNSVLEKEEAEAEAEAESLVAQLLAGETVRMGHFF